WKSAKRTSVSPLVTPAGAPAAQLGTIAEAGPPPAAKPVSEKPLTAGRPRFPPEVATVEATGLVDSDSASIDWITPSTTQLQLAEIRWTRWNEIRLALAWTAWSFQPKAAWTSDLAT